MLDYKYIITLYRIISQSISLINILCLCHTIEIKGRGMVLDMELHPHNSRHCEEKNYNL